MASRRRRNTWLALALGPFAFAVAMPLDAFAIEGRGGHKRAKAARAPRSALPRPVVVRLHDPTPATRASLSQENQRFLSAEVKLDRRIAVTLAKGLRRVEQGSAGYQLAELFDSGVTALRAMHGKARTQSTRQAIEIEASRLAAVTTQLLNEGPPSIVTEAIPGSQRGNTVARSVTSKDQATFVQLTTAATMAQVVTRIAGRTSFIRLGKHDIISRPYDEGGMRELQELTQIDDPRGVVELHRITYKDLDAHGRPRRVGVEMTKIDPKTERSVASREVLPSGWVDLGDRELSLPPLGPAKR